MSCDPFITSDIHVVTRTGVMRRLKTDVDLPTALPERLVLGSHGRTYQISACDDLKGRRRSVLISPTGSGKTVIQMFLAGYDILESNYRRLQVIVVPQNVIGEGFEGGAKHTLTIGDVDYRWDVPNNRRFCSKPQSVTNLKRLLLSKHDFKGYRAANNLGGCVAITTHAALVRAFNSMTAAEKQKMIKHAAFRLDETHHVAGVAEGIIATNHLGRFVQYVLDHGGRLHLTTATFFRGDQQILLDRHYHDQFRVYRVYFTEHWEATGLQELHMIYRGYRNDTDLMKQVVSSIAKDHSPTLIIVPSDSQSFFRVANKQQWVEKLIDKLAAIHGAENVLDLVTPAKQKASQARFNKKPQTFKVVVTCAIGREGADWRACSRIHNLTLDGNAQMLSQKLGRGLRASPDKTDVIMYNYFEEVKSWNKCRDIMSDRFNATIAAAMATDGLTPLKMPTIEHTVNGVVRTSRNVELDDVYGSSLQQVLFDLGDRYSRLGRNNEIIDGLIDDVIDEWREEMHPSSPVSDEVLHSTLKQWLVRQVNRDPKLRIPGVLAKIIRDLGWDRVYKKLMENRTIFGGSADAAAFKRVQRLLVTSDGCMEENLQQIIELCKDIPTLRRRRHETPELTRLYQWFLRNRAELKDILERDDARLNRG